MEKKNYILLGLALTILLTALFLYQSNIRKIQEFNRQVTHTLEVIYRFEKLANHVKLTQIFPQYIRKNYPANLPEYSRNDTGGVAHDLSELTTLVSDNPNQLQRLDTVRMLINTYLGEPSTASAQDSVAPAVKGAQLVALINIEFQIDKAIQEERDLLDRRREYLDNSQKISGMLRLVCVVTGLLTIFSVTAANIYQTGKRNQLESFVESVVNTSQTGILACEAIRDKDRIADFRIIFSNDALKRQLELRDGEVMKGTLLGISPTAIKRGTFARYVQTTETGMADEFETAIRRDQGLRWYQVNVNRLQDGFIASFSEITDLKTSQQELQQKVVELQRINSELEQFAYVASHDLQEPLRKIKTFSNLIIERFNDPAASFAKVYLGKVIAAANRMSILISDLLTFSSLSDQTNQFVQTDLNKILRDICHDFELIIEEKGAEITCDDLHGMEAVPLQMNQLFYNLLNNALKFSKPGVPPRISITTELLRPEAVGRHALNANLTYQQIVVKDNGIGFNPEYAKKIFVIFQRLNSKETFSGTGIGLALCHKIVANHNGLIYAESTDRQGASFYVILPLRQPDTVLQEEPTLTV